MGNGIFQLVSHPTRRQVISALRGRETPIEITLDTTDLDFDIVDEEVAQRRLIALSHIHLPKLDEADVIEWDRDHGDVSKGSNFHKYCDVLDAVTDYYRDGYDV